MGMPSMSNVALLKNESCCLRPHDSSGHIDVVLEGVEIGGGEASARVADDGGGNQMSHPGISDQFW